MAHFIIWDMSSKADGVWKNVEASDPRAAAEKICTQQLLTVGSPENVLLRVRALDNPNLPVTVFYGEKKGQAARDMKQREKFSVTLQAAE